MLPSLQDKHGEFLLKELVFRWKNHKLMVRWLSRFFYYLDRYFITRRSLMPLKKVGWDSFKTRVGSLFPFDGFYLCTKSEQAC